MKANKAPHFIVFGRCIACIGSFVSSLSELIRFHLIHLRKKIFTKSGLHDKKGTEPLNKMEYRTARNADMPPTNVNKVTSGKVN